MKPEECIGSLISAEYKKARSEVRRSHAKTMMNTDVDEAQT